MPNLIFQTAHYNTNLYLGLFYIIKSLYFSVKPSKKLFAIWEIWRRQNSLLKSGVTCVPGLEYIWLKSMNTTRTDMLSRYRTLFPYQPDPRPTFLRHTQRSRIQKLGPFRGPQKILRASEAEKKKWLKLHHFLGKK